MKCPMCKGSGGNYIEDCDFCNRKGYISIRYWMEYIRSCKKAIKILLDGDILIK